MKYTNNGKKYNVESVAFGGMIINVNGTSITNCSKLPEFPTTGYSVFVDSDEVCFDSFEKAYEFATTKQKNTSRY